MSEPLSESAKKFQNRLEEFGHSHKVVQYEESMQTVEAAAQTIGCEVEQIAKSVILRLRDSKEAVVAITSGKNNVNEMVIELLTGEDVEKAAADLVERATGYAMDGVPPIFHDHPLITFIDEDLLDYDKIWGTAGHSQAVFQLTPSELKSITLAEVITMRA